MRLVCPQGVKKMLLKRDRMVYWKKWAAKHVKSSRKECGWSQAKLSFEGRPTKLGQVSTEM